MPVPSTQEIRKPLLEAFKGGGPHSFAISNFLEIMAGHFDIDINEMSSGDKNIFRNRINEAKSDLRKFNLLSNPSKNTYMITRTGSEVLDEDPDVITDEYIAHRASKHLSPEEALTLGSPVVEPSVSEPVVDEAPEIEAPAVETQAPVSELVSEPEASEIVEEVLEEEAPAEIPELPEPEPEPEPEITQSEDFSEQEFNDAPEEIVEPEPEISQPEPEPEPELETPSGIEEVLARYNANLAEEILNKTAGIHSDKFEELVIDLLSKMGYRAFQNARYTTETSGSDLIHGVILEDKAGLTPIYIHARKLSPNRTVGRADIEDFAEALRDKGGKGIFATTGNFSEQAAITAADERIMLIDGPKLAGLMVANNFCVNVEKVFELKAIDAESFSDYEE